HWFAQVIAEVLMAFHRCPKCSIPYVDAEIESGVCPGCNAPLGSHLGLPRRDVPTPGPTAAFIPRRAAPFLLGLLVGSLIGAAALWAALELGALLPGGASEETAAFQAVQTQKS